MTRLIVVIAALIAVLCPGTAFAQTHGRGHAVRRPAGRWLRRQRLLAPRGASRGFDPNVEVILPSAAQDYVLTSGLGIGIGHDDPRTERRVGNDPPRRLRTTESRHLGRARASPSAMHHLRVTGGRNDDEGGGIEVNTGATLNLVDSEIVGNRATSGGGIWSAGNGQPRAHDRGRQHRRPGMAPAIRAAAGGSSSRAPGNADQLDCERQLGLRRAVGVYTSGPLTLQNATVAGNTATSGGGLHDLQGESVMRLNAGGRKPGRRVLWATWRRRARSTTSPTTPRCGLDGTGDRVVSGAHVAPLARLRRTDPVARALHRERGGRRGAHRLPTSRPAACGASEPMRHRRVRGQHRLRTAAATTAAAASELPPPVAGKSVNVLVGERHGQGEAAGPRALPSRSRRTSSSRSGRWSTRARAA